ncbi:hypothetical protein SSUD9_0407 [Streptococcus suis D9]|nr:hypothetical protein SSUD9_0407 [Streptococcus suis D9]
MKEKICKKLKELAKKPVRRIDGAERDGLSEDTSKV